ncbi:MAG: RNA polymerase sigma factor [Bacteroidota bacterium]
MEENSEIIALINKAKKGDQIAYKTLLNTYWKDVYRFQMSKCKNEDEAEDITIKTFAKAFDKIDTFDKKYQFKTWLISISSNIFIDHLRKQKTETVSMHKNDSEIFKITDEEPSPADKLINEQNLAQLKEYIKQLKPHYQEVINLRYFNELSYKEIAEQLDEPLTNIKVKLLRARKLLSEIIANNKFN